MKSEIKWCPFCKCQRIMFVFTDSFKYGAAKCVDCGATGPEVRTNHSNRAIEHWHSQAIQEWNKRFDNVPT